MKVRSLPGVLLDNPSSNWYNTIMSDEERKKLQQMAESIHFLLAERDEIQRELRKAETECSMLRVECGVIAAERDEARIKAMMLLAEKDFDPYPPSLFIHEKRAKEYAKKFGWDCFNKNPTGNA